MNSYEIARSKFPSTKSPTSIDGSSGSRAAHHLDTPNVPNMYYHVSSGEKRAVTIDILPDGVLLLIFHLNQLEDVDRLWHLSWHLLVHVCRRWRSVVFASPNFLDLKLVCGARTRVELTGVWPPFPIVITNRLGGIQYQLLPQNYDFDAIVHHSRLCEIDLRDLSSPDLQRLASKMQEQFPALIDLRLGFANHSGSAPALPDGFLGGSAPNLQTLKLYSVPFPALPKLLLSAIDLIHLSLSKIPHSGYISPEAIVTGLAVMTNLKSLVIAFESPLSRPDRLSRRPPPPARTVLPALTRFEFTGVSEYLEDLVARINAPLLDDLSITFFHQLIFDIPHLAQFMRLTTRFQTLNEAGVEFSDFGVRVESLPPTRTSHPPKSELKISCTKSDWQLSSLAQVLASFFPSILMVENLYIYRPPASSLQSRWIDDIENMQWLEILHPFTALRNLFVFKEFAESIAAALQELVREGVTDMLLALESLFLEGLPPSGPIQEAVEKFVAARQLLGQHITASLWERNHEVTVTGKHRFLTRFNNDPRGWTPLEFRSELEVAKKELAEAEGHDREAEEQDWGFKTQGSVAEDRDLEPEIRGWEADHQDLELEDRDWEAEYQNLEPEDQDWEAEDWETERQDSEPEDRDREAEHQPEDRDWEAEHQDLEPEDRDREAEHQDLEPEDRDREVEDMDLEPNNRAREAEDRDLEPEDRDSEAEDRDLEPEDRDGEAENRDLEPEDQGCEAEHQEWEEEDQDSDAENQGWEAENYLETEYQEVQDWKFENQYLEANDQYCAADDQYCAVEDQYCDQYCEAEEFF